MIKTYKASSIFSITVIPEGRQRMHINFYGYSHGGSFYTTGDKAIQDALETSSFFGNEFYLAETKEAAKEKQVEQVPETQNVEVKKVNVAGLQEAKEYLAETFEYTRTSLRTKTAILAAAKEHNIEFVGI